jgi:hypothetical protein
VWMIGTTETRYFFFRASIQRLSCLLQYE